MTVRSGQLTDLITFEKKVRTYDGEIEYITWVRDFQEWADAERLAEQITSYRIHYRKGITPDTHRILAFDSIWSITNVLPDARYSELKIECDWSAQIEVTHLKSPTREWITGLPAVAMPIESPEEEEEMTTTTDITALVSFPQAGVGLINVPNSIIAMKTGNLVTLAFDMDIIIPAPVYRIEITLPAGYHGKPALDCGGACTYAQGTGPTIIGTVFIDAGIDTPPAMDRLGLYASNGQLFPAGDVYFAGQLTYVTS